MGNILGDENDFLSTPALNHIPSLYHITTWEDTIFALQLRPWAKFFVCMLVTCIAIEDMLGELHIHCPRYDNGIRIRS